MTDPGRWQRDDGFPTEDYFACVAEALAEVGVDIEGCTRESDTEFTIDLDPRCYLGGPLDWSWLGLTVSWRCGDDDKPTRVDDFTGPGWHWVPYTGGGAVSAREFDGLGYLAEPGDVAAAVADLIGLGRQAQAA